MSTTYEIHPAIGICRVGDSDEFHFGPDPFEAPPTTFRDSTPDSKLKKQAVRFRVFKCDRNADGSLAAFSEIAAGGGVTIEWTVDLANRKAAADPLEAGLPTPRNHTQANRALLSITPAAKPISGISAGPLDFDDCVFLGHRLKNAAGQNVTLGAIRTDDRGRLIVTGGRGDAGSVVNPPKLQTFADNDNWWDDTSDGTVRATVTLADGTVVKPDPDPAWVLTGPPDFAPAIANIVSLYDIAYQAAVDNRWRSIPAIPSYRDDIQPILKRFVDLQWVNKTFRGLFGAGGPHDFAADWAAFGDPAQKQAERQDFFSKLRDPGGAPPPQAPELPPLNDETDNGGIQMLTPVQYRILKLWAAGTFQGGMTPAPAAPPGPDTLTRVLLDATAGAAFYPGIESNRIMRDRSHYAGPFRIQADPARPGHLVPGDVTKGNAIPWQSDFSACRQQGALGWWPAQRPDDVRTDPNSAVTVPWSRKSDGYAKMWQNWKKLGVVQAAKDAAGNTVYIEIERTLK
jgi:hypothetical protein